MRDFGANDYPSFANALHDLNAWAVSCLLDKWTTTDSIDDFARNGETVSLMLTFTRKDG